MRKLGTARARRFLLSYPVALAADRRLSTIRPEGVLRRQGVPIGAAGLLPVVGTPQVVGLDPRPLAALGDRPLRRLQRPTRSPRRRGRVADAHHCIMVGSLNPPNTRMWHEYSSTNARIVPGRASVEQERLRSSGDFLHGGGARRPGELAAWLHRGLSYAASLPPKPKKPGRKAKPTPAAHQVGSGRDASAASCERLPRA